MPDLTTAEAAAELRLTPATVAGYAKHARLPGAYRVGRTWRIPADALDAVKGDHTSLLAPRNARSTAQQRRTR